MPKHRKRRAADPANRESESLRTANNHNRIPPHTPAPIPKALARALKRLDDLADAGVNVSIIAGFDDEIGGRTALLIVDHDTYAMAGPPPIGLSQVRVGTAAHDA